MNRRLFAGTALVLAALTGPALALDEGGERISPNFQISPMTAAIVQSAQARAFQGPPPSQNRGTASFDNPSQQRALGVPQTADQAARQSLTNTIRARSQELQARPSRNQRNRGGGDPGGSGDGTVILVPDPSSVASVGSDGGLLIGGIPVTTTFVQDNRVTNVDARNIDARDQRTGNFTDVTNTTNVNGNNNMVTNRASNVGNNGRVTR